MDTGGDRPLGVGVPELGVVCCMRASKRGESRRDTGCCCSRRLEQGDFGVEEDNACACLGLAQDGNLVVPFAGGLRTEEMDEQPEVDSEDDDRADRRDDFGLVDMDIVLER